MASFPRPSAACCLLALLLPASLIAQSVNLTVDNTRTVRVVDERVFGLNSVIWDGLTSSAQTIDLLQAADIRLIRLPGGSLSDEYHWRTNTNLTNAWTWAAGFNSSTQLISGLGAQAFVTANYGTGTPEEAAAWVAYANANAGLLGTGADVSLGTDAKGYNWRTAGYWSNLRNSMPLATDDGMNFLRLGRAAPWALKYWEIGNENYGTWETDEQVVKNDPFTYANRTKAYFTLMKAVDPTIRIGVVAVTGENSNANNTSHPATNPRTGVAHNGWTPVLLATLKSLGVTPDFLIYHRYEQAPAADQPNNPETDAGLLQKALTWPADVADLRQQLTDYLGASGAGVELVVTENNSVYAKPGKQTTSLVNALFLADSVGNVLQTELNALVWWDLRNGQETGNNNSATLYGWRSYGDYGVMSSATEPYPTFYAMKLLAKFARGGDTVVRATSGSPLLSIFAARAANGALRLLVINKDPTNTLNGTVALAGFTPAAVASVTSYGKPQDDAARPGGSGTTDLVTSSQAIAGSTFSASFPSYSLTVLSIPASQTPVAPALATQPAARTVAVGQGAAFTAVATGNPSPAYQWQRQAAGAAGWENLGEGGSYRGVTTGSLTIDAATAGMSGDQFRVVVSNASSSLASNAVVLTVTGASLLQFPVGVALDPAGNLYVVDSAGNTVRKITPAGVVSTLAGTAGASGSTDGSGTSARFNQPGAVAIDAAGNLYVADTGNATVRKITPAGLVSTLAGLATSRGNQDGAGTAATFGAPSGIAVDGAGNIYVADALNATIRQITPVGVVTTLAGSAGVRGASDGQGGSARFNFPSGIAVDSSANVYVADTFNATIRKVTPAGVVSTVAGLAGVSGSADGAGANALFSLPSGLGIDGSGNLYVADTGNSLVRKVAGAGLVTTVAGLPGIAGLVNGTGIGALFNQPRGLGVDGTANLYVADSGNAAVRKVTVGGSVTTMTLSEAVAPAPGGGTDPGSGGSTTPSPSSGGGGGGAMGATFVIAVALLGLARGRHGSLARFQ